MDDDFESGAYSSVVHDSRLKPPRERSCSCMRTVRELLTRTLYILLSEKGFANLAKAFLPNAESTVSTEGTKWVKKSALETRVILPRMFKTSLLGNTSRSRAENMVWC